MRRSTSIWCTRSPGRCISRAPSAATCSRSRWSTSIPTSTATPRSCRASASCAICITKPYIANWKLNRLEAVSDQVPGVGVPFNGFMGTVGVLPGEPEVDAWVARENQARRSGRRCAAAAADRRATRRRVRSQRQPQGQVPAHHPAARERRQHGRQADGGRHHACCCHATSTAAACSSATCTTRKATAKWPAPRSRWAPRSPCAPRSARAWPRW